MTKLERVCESITRRIESGALREGDRLPSEEQLAVQHSGERGHRAEGARAPGAIGPRHARARARHLRHRVAGRARRDVQLPALPRRRGAGAAALHPPALGEAAREPRPVVRRSSATSPPTSASSARISVGGKMDLHSEFWLREAEFARLNGKDRSAAGEEPARAARPEAFACRRCASTSGSASSVLPQAGRARRSAWARTSSASSWKCAATRCATGRSSTSACAPGRSRRTW